MPDHKALQEVLGRKYDYFKEIIDHVLETYEDSKEEWKFYSKKSGWTMKMMYKKRNLFFFKPYHGYFNITFVFGDKAAKAIENSDINEELKEILRNARKYAEGRGLRVKVTSKKHLKDIKKLLAVKVAN